MSLVQEMRKTVAKLTAPDKGILAADESNTTIERRFDAIGVSSTGQTRRDYRELLFSTPGLAEFISGVIMFDETFKQVSTSGIAMPALLSLNGILSGIKVDIGTIPLPAFAGEKLTQGLDGLKQRLADYRQRGARFAKWRAVIAIGANIPTPQTIAINAQALAQYAALCQEVGLVPIIEPEVLMDGDHTLEVCARVTEETLHTVFHKLHDQRVALECMILKPNMVVAGATNFEQAMPEQVAQATLACLRRTVPPAVPGIYFLSGGQNEVSATVNLNAINASPQSQCWVLSFSYGRALQTTALNAWRGKAANTMIAQHALYRRARLNSAARAGRYHAVMEHES